MRAQRSRPPLEGGRNCNIGFKTTYKVKCLAQKVSEKLGISVSAVIERALIEYAEKYK